MNLLIKTRATFIHLKHDIKDKRHKHSYNLTIHFPVTERSKIQENRKSV